MVADFQICFCAVAFEAQLRVEAVRMAQDVGKRFLRDAEQREFGRGREAAEKI